jgi:hypothetical protein
MNKGRYGYITIMKISSKEGGTKLIVGTRSCNMLITSSMRLDIASVNIGSITDHFTPTNHVINVGRKEQKSNIKTVGKFCLFQKMR